MGFRMELVQGATPICEGSCHLTPLRGTSCWNDCKSCKVRVGSNGNSLWEVSVLLGRRKGCAMETLKFVAMPFGLTNTPAVFIELMSKARKDDRGVSKGREDVRNEPILALPEGADDFVVYYDARSKDLEACLGKRDKEECYVACATIEDVAGLEPTIVKREREWIHIGFWKTRVRTSIWRDVRTLAIEEAYTTKYSIHPGADTMLCGFRLTNRWLSMKKDIASCGSKYLAYSKVEVEYQGSSGLLLQPELPE
ncbi:hypothetical protein Tco_0247789 [Tanacetum coccineum]